MSRIARTTARHEIHGATPRNAVVLRAPAPLQKVARLARPLFGESLATNALVVTLLVLMALLLVRPMIMSALSYHRSAQLLEDRRAEVAKLERRNAQLKKELDYYSTDQFLIERAREYGLVLPGEQPYVIRELARGSDAPTRGASSVR